MSSDYTRASGGAPDGAELRWQLRGLRFDEAPGRDLWPGIAARLAAVPAGSAVPPDRALGGRNPRPRAGLLPAALAASVILAVGWLVEQYSGSVSAGTSVVQREAAEMSGQYRAAIDQAAGPGTPVPASLQAAFDELDRNAGLILDALAEDPDSRLLLQQLRRTYDHRLQLARRAALG